VTEWPESTASMVDQIGRAIAKADGADVESDPSRDPSGDGELARLRGFARLNSHFLPAGSR